MEYIYDPSGQSISEDPFEMDSPTHYYDSEDVGKKAVIAVVGLLIFSVTGLLIV